MDVLPIFLAVVTIGSNLPKVVVGVGAEKVLYTIKEYEALEQTRSLVKGDLTQDYMTEDAFLIRFLQATDLQIEKAVEMIRKSMTWRTENRIDGIMQEENSVDKELPYTVGIDKENRPAALIKAGETDLRKVIISGKRDLAVRSGWKLVETLAAKARSLNSSQVVGVIDLNGFSYRRHACSECIPFGQEMGEAIEANYPGMAAAMFFVNTPRIFEVLLRVIKAVLTESSRRVLHVYGFDKGEWTEALLKWISHEELNQLFGYTLKITPNANHVHIRHSHHIKPSEWEDEEDLTTSHRNALDANLSSESNILFSIHFVMVTVTTIGLYFNIFPVVK